MDLDADSPLDDEDDEQYSDDAYEEAGPAEGNPGFEPSDMESHSDSSFSDSGASDLDGDSSQNEDQRESASLKRGADDNEGDDPSMRPFKRRMGIFNNDYLDLLNEDIEDAAMRACLPEEDDPPPTQIGLTTWSSLEKALFFEALGRVGRDNLPAIAARIGSKGVLEIRQYLHFLQRALELRRTTVHRLDLSLSDYPAAIELSQRCCHVLDEAADAISVRQEQVEQQRERDRWADRWDITSRVAVTLDRQWEAADGEQPRFARLFYLSHWLNLSRRAFMNSSTPGDNWHYMEDHPPSVWATAFDDFHSLAVSVTRRLVQTTLFISMSRIRAKREAIASTEDLVRSQDVEAAVASLGMPSNSGDFWLKSARRLRLTVYEEPPNRDAEGEEDAMTYEEVEAALGEGQSAESTSPPESTEMESPPSIEDLDDEAEVVELGASKHGLGEVEMGASEMNESEVYASDESESEASQSPSEEEEDDDEVTQEAKEVLLYSITDLSGNHHKRQTLRNRIAKEREMEQHADRHDAYVSAQAEMEMWQLLQMEPPAGLGETADPGSPPMFRQDVEGVHEAGRDWRDKMRYYSEWETLGGRGMGASS